MVRDTSGLITVNSDGVTSYMSTDKTMI
jgi:hypothetical protein